MFSPSNIYFLNGTCLCKRMDRLSVACLLNLCIAFAYKTSNQSMNESIFSRYKLFTALLQAPDSTHLQKVSSKTNEHDYSNCVLYT